MPKKHRTVLMLSVSAGAGHVRAAQALKKTAEEQFPDCDPVHIDLMDCVPQIFRKMYSESYIKIVERSPALWEFLYQQTDKVPKESSVSRKLRVAVQDLNTRDFVKKLAEIRPDAVVCTHFLPPEIISKLIRKGKFSSPCWVAVTDFDIHGLWIQPDMAGYFVASDEVAWRLKEKGVGSPAIKVTGIPVMPVFGRKYDRKECAAELGINPATFTIVLMSGGLGVGGINVIAEKLMTIDREFQVVALAGKNVALLDSLKVLAEKHPRRLFPMGFTTTIERIMAASDLAVSKPGGLTTSECLAMGLPMIVISPIPGQEERNADFLLENGAALKAHDAAVLEFKVRQLLDDRSRLKSMRENALRISHPRAANEILETVVAQ